MNIRWLMHQSFLPKFKLLVFFFKHCHSLKWVFHLLKEHFWILAHVTRTVNPGRSWDPLADPGVLQCFKHSAVMFFIASPCAASFSALAGLFRRKPVSPTSYHSLQKHLRQAKEEVTSSCSLPSRGDLLLCASVMRWLTLVHFHDEVTYSCALPSWNCLTLNI